MTKTPLQESLSKCKIQGNVLFLPTEQLPNYPELRKALINAGAAYKRNTFVFPNPAQQYVDKLMGGQSVNLKKEFQFFATPPQLANRLVELSNIDEKMIVLEPSAGQGAIIEAIYKAFPKYMKGPNDKPSVTVDYCEIMDLNQKVISEKIRKSERWSSSTSFMGPDFLQYKPDRLYDRIIANPPFSKNQDIDHIRKMYDCLKPGGRLVSIASKSWSFGSQKKQIAFRKWLNCLDAKTEEIDNGSFQESGTSVGGFIIIIDKK